MPRSAGGNVGILVGEPSARIVALDLDADFALIAALLPELCNALITRAEAPQRAKLLLRLTAPMPNRSWRPAGSRRPLIELLAHRRIAVVPPSIHPSGEGYRLQRGAIPLLTPDEVDDLWEILTADCLANTPPSHVERAMLHNAMQRNALDSSMAERRFATAFEVFDYFGRVGEVEAAGQHDLGLLGNGGLLVGRPEGPYAWRWYCFADGVGGGVAAAVRWCEGGS